MGNAVDYDPQEVITYCERGAQEDLMNLVNDLNKLCTELDDCQDKFHCKGGDNANAVIKIYKGFSNAIGKSNGAYSGEALGGCCALTAQIINIIYGEARADLKAQEASQYNINI